MKKAKKLLVTLLVLTFVLSIMGTGFAATSFSDVTDEEVADAVTRLSALDILNGYPDGTFKPDNPITRAEFAKIIVNAVGVGSAAEYAKGTTQFKDVPADYWASGYIKVASDMKIVNGRGNGVFDPGANVTYAEAITMIVRALGYEPKAQALGGYPGGYLAIASEKDITDGINVVNTLAATRGDIAKMINNSLDVNLMEQTSYGDETSYEEVDKTLLTDKLSTTKYEGVVITSIPRLNGELSDNEIEVQGNLDDDEDDVETDTFEVLTDVVDQDINSLFGLKVDLYVNDDDEVFYIVQSDDSKVYFDEVDPAGPDDDETGAVDYDEDGKDGEITLIKNDDDFKLADEDDLIVYAYDEDGDLISGSDIDTYDELSNFLDDGGVFGKFVTNDDNEIQYMELYKWSEVDGGVVTAVDTSNETITVFNEDEDEEEIDLTEEDGYKIFDSQFNEISLDDIEKYNVVYVQMLDDEATGDTLYYVFVVKDNTVTGTLDEYSDEDDEIDVGDETYDVGRLATVSIDEDDTIIDINTDEDEFYSRIDDALDEDVTVVFDIVGHVRHITTAAEASSDELYGIVTGTKEDYDDEYVRIYTQNGESVSYLLDLDDDSANDFDDVDTAYEDADTDDEIVAVAYTINSDGEIDTIELLGTLSGDEYTPDIETVAEDGIDDDAIETDADNTYVVDDDAVIFDVEEYLDSEDVDDIDIVEWASIKDKDAAGDEQVIVYADSKDEAKALFFVSGISHLGDDEYAGYVVNVKSTSSGDKADVAVFGEGSKTYYVDDDYEVDDESIVLFTLNADEEIVVENLSDYASYDLLFDTDDDFDTAEDSVAGYVYDKDGDYIRFAGWTDSDGDGNVDDDELDLTGVYANYYKISSSTVIYDEDDVQDKYDIHEKDIIEEVLVDNKTIKVIKID